MNRFGRKFKLYQSYLIQVHIQYIQSYGKMVKPRLYIISRQPLTHSMEAVSVMDVVLKVTCALTLTVRRVRVVSVLLYHCLRC